MKEATQQLLELIFSIFLLLSALVYIVFYTTETVPAFDEIEKANETVFIKETEIPTKVAWTGAQVVGKLYRLNEDNVSITVNTLNFKTDEDVMNLVSLIDTTAQYESSFTYDANGKIQHVQFDTIY